MSRAGLSRAYLPWPRVLGRCCDCGLGTYAAHEWYMVRDEVWEEAWRGRWKWWHQIEGQQILCIGCLEKRLGRTLIASDFTAVPINNPNKPSISERLRDRLTASESIVLRRKRGRPKGGKNKPKPSRPKPRQKAILPSA
jgi:hypothetical protein